MLHSTLNEKRQQHIRVIYYENMYRGRLFDVGPGVEDPSGEIDPLVDATNETLSGAGGGNRARSVLKHESVSWPGPDLVYIYISAYFFGGSSAGNSKSSIDLCATERGGMGNPRLTAIAALWSSSAALSKSPTIVRIS